MVKHEMEKSSNLVGPPKQILSNKVRMFINEITKLDSRLSKSPGATWVQNNQACATSDQFNTYKDSLDLETKHTGSRAMLASKVPDLIPALARFHSYSYGAT